MGNCDIKRMNVEDDRLSSLPDDLIHKILALISTKQAIETSVLSSRWRYIWTSMPYLDFSSEDFHASQDFDTFVTDFLSAQNNQTSVHSVKLNFKRVDDLSFVEEILKSTLELPLLTTLYLHYVVLCSDENTNSSIGVLFSKFANLKNLTLKHCRMVGAEGLCLCLPLLSTLTLDDVYGNMKGFNIVAPQLKNLTIRNIFVLQDLQCLMISAPGLVFFLYKGYKCLPLSTDDFLSLEKADIYVYGPTDAHQVLRMLQQLHNVKSLTLNLEIVELLSSSSELMSCQSSPFANLESLNFHPVSNGKKRVKMSAQVKSYLLDSSPGATFKAVSREIEKAIAELRALLEHEKSSFKTERAKMLEQGKEQVDIDSCWKYMSVQSEEGKEMDSNIMLKLKEIKELLVELPASKRAIFQPSFSTLCAEASIVTKKIIDCIKMDCEENQGRLSEYFNELVTMLQPSSSF